MADWVATAILMAALSLPLWFGLGLIAPVRIDVEPRARRAPGRRTAPRVRPSAEVWAEAEELSQPVEAELEPVAG